MLSKTAAKGNNLLQLYTGTFSETGVSFAAAGLTIPIDRIIDSSLEGTPAKGNLKITCTTKQYDEDLDNFLTVMGTSDTSEDEKVMFEDRQEQVFSSTLPNAKTFGAVFVGGTIGKVPLTFGRAKLSGNTGNIKYSSKSAETTFEITFLSGMVQTWAADCFTGACMAALFAGPVEQTIQAADVAARVWATSA